ncbi:Aste57867_8659 [Aphanomyces stellatus]|uniref:Aste57867_8659 protein n=1 Tax=Aphanomyces stellatus TaxID=120398 RepID=A0A485KKY1_9STRA|nr:hypothetical protein As57867_008625 [Aphanomyces stellatus]VFT85545.1 Aste57867_8659 [Aphanomyces stellatus]
MKLPLPPNFFDCPPLAPQMASQLHEQAHATAMEVVDKALVKPSSTTAWSLMSSYTNGLKIYRAKDSRETSPHVKLCVGVAEVAGTIDEVVELFRNDTTERAKAYVARFGKGLLDSANLYTLAEPTADQPHDSVAINWTAFQSPVKNVVLPRDCCYLEGQFEFHDASGRRGWVRSVKSTNLTCCPDMQQSHGLVRMHQLGAGHVFLESKRPGYLRIAYVVHSAFNVGGFVHGAAADWAIEKAIKRRCASLLDLDGFLRENRLAKGKFLFGDQLVPKDSRHACALCNRRFGLFVSRSNCFKCGEVFCSDCNNAWVIPIVDIPTRIDACKKCAMKHPTTKPRPASAMSTRSKGTTSSFLSGSMIKRTPSLTRSLATSPESPSSLSDHQSTNERWIQEFLLDKSIVDLEVEKSLVDEADQLDE